MFYGGLVRTKNVLGTMMHSFVAMAIIGVLWVACGYALAFGKNILGGFVGWNKDYFFLNGIDDVITDGVPEYVLAMFQKKFAIITPALISGTLLICFTVDKTIGFRLDEERENIGLDYSLVSLQRAGLNVYTEGPATTANSGKIFVK